MKINGLAFVVENYQWLFFFIILIIAVLYLYDKYICEGDENIDNDDIKLTSKTFFLKDYDIKSAKIGAFVLLVVLVIGYLILH